MSLPRHSTRPPLGLASPSRQRAIVVLPLPLSPTMLRIRGGCSWNWKDTLSTAMVGRRLRAPPNTTEPFCSSRSGVLGATGALGGGPREQVAGGGLAGADGDWVAGDDMRPGRDLSERRLDSPTDFHYVRTARVKAA